MTAAKNIQQKQDARERKAQQPDSPQALKATIRELKAERDAAVQARIALQNECDELARDYFDLKAKWEAARTCEWTQDRHHDYSTGCKQERMMWNKPPVFCPYCGHRVVVAESKGTP